MLIVTVDVFISLNILLILGHSYLSFILHWIFLELKKQTKLKKKHGLRLGL